MDAGFRRANSERVNVFPVSDRYLFKHYFDEDSVFDRLKRYYNKHQYRFEVPEQEYPEVRTFLQDYGYGLVTVAAVEAFVVVVEKYSEHPENIFKESVIQRSKENYNCFLMTGQDAVDHAVETGHARKLADTALENPF